MNLVKRMFGAALAVLLVASFASAKDEDLGRLYTKDKKLGAGTFKSAWTVKDAKTGKPIPGKVLVLVDQTESWEDMGPDKVKTLLADEDAQLERLAKAGVPAATYDAIGTYKGTQAGILDQYAASNRDWMEWSGDDVVEDASALDTKKGRVRWDLLNEKSLASVEKIRKGLAKSRLYVRDPQVLIGEDGSIVIADPMEVDAASETEHTAAFQQRMDTLLSVLDREAHAAILARKIEALDGLPRGNARRIATWTENGPERFRELLVKQLDSGGAEIKKIAAAFRDGTLRMSFLGELEADAKDVVHLTVDGSWHRLVYDVVRKGSERLAALEKGRVTLETKVESAVKALFFSKDKYGDALDRSVPRGPKTVADLVLDERGRPVTDAERDKAVGLAKDLLGGRGPRTAGLTSVLGERVADGASGDRDRER